MHFKVISLKFANQCKKPHRQAVHHNISNLGMPLIMTGSCVFGACTAAFGNTGMPAVPGALSPDLDPPFDPKA